MDLAYDCSFRIFFGLIAKLVVRLIANVSLLGLKWLHNREVTYVCAMDGGSKNCSSAMFNAFFIPKDGLLLGTKAFEQEVIARSENRILMMV